MKRFTVFFAAFAALSCAALFAAPKPSIDGRAVVADSGVLPRGPYGKSIGFLPGDSVTVTNPAVGVAIDVMILGALDSSEGIAILLSPEAADALFIAKDSQALVTITKKSAAADTPAAVQGGAPANASNGASRVNPGTAKADPDADAFKALPPGIAEKFGETTRPADTSIAQNNRAAPVSAPVAERSARAAELGEDNGIDWSSAVYDEPLPEIATNADTFYSELLPPAIPAAPAAPVQTPATLAPAPVISAPPVAPPPPAIVSAAPPPADTPPAAPPPSPQDNLDSIALLIPTEPRPPVSSGKPPSAPSSSAAPATPVEPPPPPPKEAQPEPSSSAAAAQPENSATAWSPPEPAPHVMRIKALEREKYYVQIATFSNPDSIKTIAAKYGDKYPLVQIVNDTAASSQVLIGPLGADEYGAVLARFKSYGYADAFLRTGK